MARTPRSGWREQVLARAASAEALVVAPEELEPELLAGFRQHLAGARDAASGRRTPVTGAAVERAWANVHAAEEMLLLLVPNDVYRGLEAATLARASAELPAEDGRLVALHAAVGPAEPVSPRRRALAYVALTAAHARSSAGHQRARSFRNVVWVAAALLLLGAVGLGVVGSVRPELVPLCSTSAGSTGDTEQAPADLTDREPVQPVQPSGFADPSGLVLTLDAGPDRSCLVGTGPGPWDLWVVALVGAVAGLVSGVGSLRRIGGTSVPYAVPVALAYLKAPLGAVVAMLGLVATRGGLGSAATDPTTLLALAVVLGASQQLLSRWVDDRGEAVLHEAASPQGR